MKKLFLLITCVVISSCNLFNPSGKELDLIPYIQKDKYGYFDLEGKIVINPQFGYATAFREDVALVRTTGDAPKWGFIDQEGKYIINATYTNATIFSEGIAWVTTENSAPIAINTKGETLFTMKQADRVALFSEGLAAFSVADSTEVKWGFVDAKGSVKINPQFKSVHGFINGKCAVENKEGKWGYIDLNGKLVINYQFDDAHNFINELAAVVTDDKAGVIDEEGKYVINPQFDKISSDGNLFYVEQDDKIGWVDEKGKFVINPQFEEGNLFFNSELAAVKSGDSFGYVNDDGKIMINPQFDAALPFVNGKALVKSGDKIGVIDTEGRFVVNPQFEDLSYDLYVYLNSYEGYGTIRSTIKSEYFDVDRVVRIFNFTAPEQLSFSDSFITIAKKMNKKLSDFNTYDESNVLVKNKIICDDAKYSFGVLGEAKTYNYSTYHYTMSDKSPFGFIYVLELKNKGFGKVNAVKKALERKLKSYTTLKRGTVGGEDVVVFKNEIHSIILVTNGKSNLTSYILNKDFDLTAYLNKIVSEDQTNDDYVEQFPTEEVVEEVAPVEEEYVGD